MKGFMAVRFGNKQGAALFLQQKNRLSRLLDNMAPKSKSQLKTLKKFILPYIALYQVLIENLNDINNAQKILDEYIIYKSNQLSRFYHIAELLPFFFSIFRIVTVNTMKADSWNSTFDRNDSCVIQFTVTKCLWYDTCKDLGCPEICELFCNGDDTRFGSMKKITFKRSKTLGKGGDCCDFHFINNQKSCSQ